MPQAFKFGFGDEDIEVADVGEDDTAQDEAEPTTEEVSDQGIAPCVHSLDDIVSIS